MKEPTFRKSYTNVRQAMYDEALTSPYFDVTSFNAANKELDSNYADYYMKMATDYKDSYNPEFDTNSYELLSGDYNHQLMYMEHYLSNKDRTEMSKDEYGNEYNVWDAEEEYLNSIIDQKEREKWYGQLNGFEKVMVNVGAVLGDMGNAIYSYLDKIGDALVLLGTWNADLWTFGAYHKELGEAARSAIDTDWSGTERFANELAKLKSVTWIGKSDIGKMIDDIAVGVANMLPILVAPVASAAGVTGTALSTISGVGRGLYTIGMIGGAAGDAVKKNPNIDLHSLALYSAAITLVEEGTELVSDKIQGLITGTPGADFISSIVTGSPRRQIMGSGLKGVLKELGMSFVSEGLEEMTSEFIDGVLDWALVTGNTDSFASMQDILYAGLVGGATGLLLTGGDIALTKNMGYIKGSGTIVENFKQEAAKVVDTDNNKTYSNRKEAIEAGAKNIRSLYTSEQLKKLGKIDSKNIRNARAMGYEAIRIDNVDDFYNKHSSEFNALIDKGVDTDQAKKSIQEKYAKEYNKAVRDDEKNAKTLADITTVFATVMHLAGAEGFEKAVDIADLTRNDQARLIRNFTEKTVETNAVYKAIQREIESKLPQGTSFNVSEDLTAAQVKLQDEMLKDYGIQLVYGDYGEANGKIQDTRFVLSGEYAVLDKELFKDFDKRRLAEQYVKATIIEKLQQDKGVMSKTAVKALAKILNSLDTTNYNASLLKDIQELQSKEITEKMSEKELNKYAQSQRNILSQLLMFDEMAVSDVFYGSSKTFNNMYKWLKKEKMLVEKSTNTPLLKIRYNTLLKAMKMYEETIAKNSPNQQYANDQARDAGVDEDGIANINSMFRADTVFEEFEHMAYVPITESVDFKNYMNAHNAIKAMTNNRFTFEQAFNPEIYNEDIVEGLSKTVKEGKSFQYALQEYLLRTYNMLIDTVHRCFVKATQFNEHVSMDFALDLMDLESGAISIEEFANNHQTIGDCFDEDFNTHIYDETNGDNLYSWSLQFVDKLPQNANGVTDVAKKIVYIKLNQDTLLDPDGVAGVEHSIYHETQHIIAQYYNSFIGSNPETIGKAFKNSPNFAAKLYNVLANDEFIPDDTHYNRLGNLVYGRLGGELLAESSVLGGFRDKTSIFAYDDFIDITWNDINKEYVKMTLTGYGIYKELFNKMEIVTPRQNTTIAKITKNNYILKDVFGLETLNVAALQELGLTDEFINAMRVGNGDINKETLKDLIISNQVTKPGVDPKPIVDKILDFKYSDNVYIKNTETAEKMYTQPDKQFNHTKLEYTAMYRDLLKAEQKANGRSIASDLKKAHTIGELKTILNFTPFLIYKGETINAEEKIRDYRKVSKSSKATPQQKVQALNNINLLEQALENKYQKLDAKFAKSISDAQEVLETFENNTAIDLAIMDHDFDGSADAYTKIENDSKRLTMHGREVFDTLSVGDKTVSRADQQILQDWVHQEQSETESEKYSTTATISRIKKQMIADATAWVTGYGKTASNVNALDDLTRTIESLDSMYQSNKEDIDKTLSKEDIKMMEELKNPQWFIKKVLPKDLDSFEKTYETENEKGITKHVVNGYDVRKKIQNNKEGLIKLYGEDGYKQILEVLPVERSNDIKTIRRLYEALDERGVTFKDRVDKANENTPAENKKLINDLKNAQKKAEKIEQNLEIMNELNKNLNFKDLNERIKNAENTTAVENTKLISDLRNANKLVAENAEINKKLTTDFILSSADAKIINDYGEINTYEELVEKSKEIKELESKYKKIHENNKKEFTAKRDEKNPRKYYEAQAERFISIFQDKNYKLNIKDQEEAGTADLNGNPIDMTDKKYEGGYFLSVANAAVKGNTQFLIDHPEFIADVLEKYSEDGILYLGSYKEDGAITREPSFFIKNTELALALGIETYQSSMTNVDEYVDNHFKNFGEGKTLNYPQPKDHVDSGDNVWYDITPDSKHKSEESLLSKSELLDPADLIAKNSEEINKLLNNKAVTHPQRGTPIETIEKVDNKKGSTIADAIISIVESNDVKRRMSEIQNIEENVEHVVFGEKFYNDYIDTFSYSNINETNVFDIYEELKKSGNDVAVTAYEIYMLAMSDIYDTETSKKIHDLLKAKLTQDAQRMAAQARRVTLQEHPARDMLQQLEKDGYKAEMSDEFVAQFDERIAKSDEHCADLKADILDLEDQIKNTKDELKKYELGELKTAKLNELNVFKNGTNTDKLDYCLTHLDSEEGESDNVLLAKQDKAQRDFRSKLEFIIEKALEEDKEVGLYLKDPKTGDVKAFPKTREFLAKAVKKLRNFRMWAMLSSPTTWIRNWTGNLNMKVLDRLTNDLERLLSKRVFENFDYDAELKKLDEKRQKLTELQKQMDMLSETHPEYTKLVSEIDKTKLELEKLKKTSHSIQSEMGTLNKALRSTIPGFNQFMKTHKQQLEKLKQDSVEYQSLVKESQKTKDSIAKLNEDLKEYETQKTKIINELPEIQKLDDEIFEVRKEIHKAEVELQQLQYQGEKASVALSNYLSEEFGDYVLNTLVRHQGERYDPTGGKSAEVKRLERATEYKSASAIKKLMLKAQDITDYGLSSGPLGDEPRVRASTLRNMANMLASNVNQFLVGIKLERDTLLKKGDLTDTESKRLEVLNKAIETKNDLDVFKALNVDEAERLFANAAERAEIQFFRNPNWLSRAFSTIASKSPALAEVISWIMPFPKVAGNILSMAYRYSPFGFVSTLIQWSKYQQKLNDPNYKGEITGFEKADIVRSASQASIGTFMLIAGAIAAALNWISIDDDDYIGMYIKVGNAKIALSDLAPSMTTFATAGSLIYAWKNHKSGVEEALNTLYDHTLIGNLDNIFRYGGLTKFAENIPVSLTSQYVPAILKLINNTVFKTPQKDKSGNLLEKTWKTLAASIPGLALTVPNKVNPYTGEPMYSSGVSGNDLASWLLNFISKSSPVTIKFDYGTSDLEKEAKRLGTGTTGSSGTFTINGKNYTVKNKEKLAKFRANYIESEFEKIQSGKTLVTVKDEKTGKMITTKYSKLTDSQRQNVLTNLYSKASNASKIEYWTSTGNKYVATTTEEYQTLKKTVTSPSKIIFNKNWSKSKFVEG